MSGIIEMRDGYGWSTSGGSIELDGDGYYYLVDGGGAEYVEKIIYVAEQKISPVYIFYQMRVYSMAANTEVDLTITGLTETPITTVGGTPIAIADSGSELITIEGYTTSATVKVKITQAAAGDDFKVYLMNESGI